jgi:5-methylthioribose kinase
MSTTHSPAPTAERSAPRPGQGRFVGGESYAPLNEASLRAWLPGQLGPSVQLGGSPSQWTVREVGDGNLNLVFIVKGTQGGVVVKQALPYVRLVGESWPLPLDRAYFEWQALRLQAGAAPGLVPQLHGFDAQQAALTMELLEPHVILRKGLIAGRRYPKLATDIARFMAATLFKTSDLGSPAAQKKERLALFAHNTALCRITEDLVFTDPYRIAELNRWTSPQLDSIAQAFRTDAALKLAVQELKWAFMSRSEALLHGDLHTGSVMVTAQDTRVIDPEFAFFGPMGFDPGAFMANLLLAYFSQPGHAGAADDRRDYGAWILDTLEAFWTSFEQQFLALWRAPREGDVFLHGLFEDEAGAAALDAHRHRCLSAVFADAAGFAGAKMARRILGLAHVEDLESIADPDRRAACERKALCLARELVLGRSRIGSVATLRSWAEAVAVDPST